MDDAVPSIFPWSAASPKRKSPRKRSRHPSSAAEMPSFWCVSEEDNDSPASDEISDLRAHIEKLEEQIKSLQQENKHLLKNVDELLERKFGITRFKDSDLDINFFTGFPNYKTLLACYNFLKPGENGENIVYVNSATEDLEFSASGDVVMADKGRYVDDTFAIVTSVPAAEDLLSTLNNCHPSIHFTMELASGNKLPFVGMEVLKKGCKLETSVYRKPTNTGLLLHPQSHVDKRYKKSLLKTMLNRAFRLSSTWESFKSECDHLKMMFTNLKYPDHLINSTISHFVTPVRSENPGVQAQLSVNENAVHRVVLPFKDQKSADAVKRQLSDLSNKIDHTLHPVFKSRKICEDLRVREPKPPIVSQQCVVYNYKCDLCDAEYVGYTSRHLHQLINEHRNSAIGKRLKNEHGLQTIGDLTKHFNVLKKCTGKLDCLVHEMLFIKKMKPSLNKQSDSIRAKLFI
ncbi:hypothetical protein AWC38_SpisGene5143 [Stylophora pistillata]|uniref:C2H2-type domain-containing protein n=1 Tax=Stylophora pistillata TaxID=50429 RepID=A0A2B4SL17_STYPI|nr:hypothetical protein AWC38_SpisGene5143 [Stylophora pistillata]